MSINERQSTAQESGLPESLTGPLVWSGSDFETEESYAYTFDEEDIEEVDNALKNFLSLGLNGDAVSRSNFLLPRLGDRLRQAAESIHRGRGFVVFKGLDPSRYSVAKNVIIYLGLANYVADKRGLQDKHGNVLTHITSSKLWDAPKEKRHGIHSNEALPFHTDMGCDILALQVRQSAESGGCTYLSSAWAVFNQLLRQEPDLAKVLLTPNWPVQISDQKSHHYLAPVFAIQDGRLLASMDPQRLGPHPKSVDEGVPALTGPQRQALDKVSEVARRTELRLKLGTGDLLFLNNWALMHRRDGYDDEKCLSRHLVRLWLRNTELGWFIPSQMLPPWQAAFEEGSGIEMTYPLHPPATYIVPKYSTGSAAFVMDDTRRTGLLC
ncbi:hypothetical protein XA68_18281 [Ophiocordyceps unilateralis]|uniref:TauD/TfdA-like domain-containing protein n=1 Tax=Ophiocordyceps unilateralis TaxID=268505 RepID=A0A2A9PJL6_OPHUN|nr:hypothetical protein XA68_18281 [Ophiocordyceps unilateralis]